MTKLDSWYARHSDSEKKRRADFANEFKSIRNNNNLSINEIAIKLGVSAEFVARIEAGEVSPDVPNLRERLKRVKTQSRMIIS